GKAAFLAPEIGITPLSFSPPVMVILSMVEARFAWGVRLWREYRLPGEAERCQKSNAMVASCLHLSRTRQLPLRHPGIGHDHGTAVCDAQD
ncbi:MAG: hypothetical protein ACRC7C_11550, partial [Beijerinckiaceae bacterium]